MRAIDADGVSEILTRVIEEQKKSHHVDEVIGLMEARTEVNNAPTLDVKPVVHAHLIEDEFGFQSCCKCGYAWDGLEYATPYCPNCGAKMDEEDRDD